MASADVTARLTSDSCFSLCFVAAWKHFSHRQWSNKYRLWLHQQINIHDERIERKKGAYNFETRPSCHLIDTIFSSDFSSGRTTRSGTVSAGEVVDGRSAAALGFVLTAEVWNARLEYLPRTRAAKGALFPEQMV
jgi:hypothetical protein